MTWWWWIVPAYLQGFETNTPRFRAHVYERVPAYLQGFETSLRGRGPALVSSSSIPTRVRNYAVYSAIGSLLEKCSSIPTRVRNVVKGNSKAWYNIVPAYLQGFETLDSESRWCEEEGSSIPTRVRNFSMRLLSSSPLSVPAYLQGFETRWRPYTPRPQTPFQHTYKGSKLGGLL